MQRRHFVDKTLRICGAAAAAVSTSPALLANTSGPVVSHGSARLVFENGIRLRASELEVGTTYIFRYPFTETPCFLINLGTSTPAGKELTTKSGKTYHWQGGTGPDNSIVAFSAICSHKLSHPARSISFINYQHQKVNFSNADAKPDSRQRVILCCSERSVYDATAGGEVLGGPAPQPLAAVVLAYHAGDDSLTATGIQGSDMFDAFFEKFGPRLKLERGSANVRVPAADTAEVVTIEQYSNSLRNCG